MGAFRYQAATASGGNVTGVIEAQDRRSAIEELSRQGLYPSDLKAVAEVAVGSTQSAARAGGEVKKPLGSPRETTEASSASASSPGSVVKGVSRKEITAVTRQISTLVGATIAIPTALNGLAQQEKNEKLRQVLLGIADSVRGGDAFSEALANYPNLFPLLYRSMVQVGEESGQLELVLNDLADLMERQDQVRGEITSAIAYPAFVFGFGVVTTVILLTFVMPRLLGVLDGLTAALPLPTKILLALSAGFNEYWYVILIGTAGLGILGFRYLKTEAGAYQFDKSRLDWPVFGPLFRSAALARFARTLSTLHRSGVSLVKALDIVRNTVGNRYIAARISEVAEGTKGGDSLSAPIQRLELFPPTMVQMIAVGEETGRLDEMLSKVAEIQDRITQRTAKTLVSLLGPVLILVVGAVVGFIVISLLLPIFQISQSMQ